jgi:hypothetical protein
VIAALAALTASAGTAQGTKESVRQLLPRLTSPDIRVRYPAAMAILSSRDLLHSSGVSRALVELLDLENNVIAESYRRRVGVSREYGEEYGDYYSKLLQVVFENADLQDSRTVRTLGEASYNPDSRFAMALADKVGAKLFDVATDLYYSDMLPRRWNGLSLIGYVYEKRDMHRVPTDRALKMKDVILNATANEALRGQALEIIERVGTPADLPLLRRISESDSESVIHPRKGRVFPNREKAAAAIKAILARHPSR